MDEVTEVERLVTEVVKHLDGWTLAPFNDSDQWTWPKMTHNNGGMLFFHGPGWTRKPGMMQVSGSYPVDSVRGISSPGDFDREAESLTRSINISVSKTPETIARDIERRLLPDYLKGLEIVKKGIKASQTKRGHAHERLTEVLSYLGKDTHGNLRGKVRESGMVSKDRPKGDINIPEGYMNCETSDGESFTLDIRYVPFDVAYRICAAIREGVE